jgi:hypothetical protein
MNQTGTLILAIVLVIAAVVLFALGQPVAGGMALTAGAGVLVPTQLRKTGS